jgi:membrane protease YdiL (CAAX protease family)
VPLGIGYSVAIRFAVGIVLFAMVLLLLATGVLTQESVPQFLTSGRPDVKKLVDISAMRNNSSYFWLMVTLNSFVLAGLREEMWRAGTLAAMRALWPNPFGDRLGQIVAVALIAILFGFAHSAFGLLAIGVAALLGFCLGVIMVVHESIWPAVIAHGFLDATTFALLSRSGSHLH